MAVGLGSDFACVTDLDPAFTVVSEKRCLAEAIARRLGTPAEHLFYDPDYGEDLSELIGSSTTAFVIQQRAEREGLKDDRCGAERGGRPRCPGVPDR